MEKIPQKKKKGNIEEDATFEATFPFFISPNSIIDIEGTLTTYEKLTYLILCRYGNLGRVAFPSYNTIAKKGGFSKDTAIRAVKGLLQKGGITKKNTQAESGGHTTNNYTVDYYFLDLVAHSYKGSSSQQPGVVADSNSINSDLIKKYEEAGAAAEPSANGKAELGNIIGHYKEMFEVYADSKAHVKDEEAKALKLLLQDNSAEDIKNMITLMFQDSDPYWLKEGYPLLVFAKQRNKFAARLAEKKKGANKNNTPKEGQPFTIVYGSTGWDDHMARQREIERKLIVGYEEPASGEPAAEEVKAGFATVKGILTGKEQTEAI